MDKWFILHWLDGRKEFAKGRDIADACRRAGLGGGALRALDYWSVATDAEVADYKYNGLLVYAHVRIFGRDISGWVLVDDPPEVVQKLAGGAIMFEPVG